MQKKAIFLDRDGVINQNRKDYVKELSEFEIFDWVGESVKLFKDAGYLVIIITNQSAIGRRLLTHEELKKIHDCLENYLKTFKTKIDAIYYCPHTPEDNCDCRKPKPGLLLAAIQDFQVDLSNSWMVGDSTADIMAATSAGCRSYMIKENLTLLDIAIHICKG